MNGTETSGAARRLTPDEERRGAELFAAGRSERDVAAALGVGNGTAHRLRERLAAAAAPDGALTEPGTPSAETAAQGPGAPNDGDARERERDGRLAELREQRNVLDGTAVEHDERAATARKLAGQIEQERLDALAAGQDATPFRARWRNAQDDAADFMTAAALVREQLVPIDAEIARLERERELEATEAARQAASAEAARLAALAPGALREAFAQAHEVAAGLAAIARALKAASAAAGEHVFPELMARLNSGRDPWFDSIMALWRIAEGGDAQATLAAIVNCGTWRERDAGELARERAAFEEQWSKVQQEADANSRPRHTGPGPYPNRGAPMPGFERVTQANVHIDENGYTDAVPPGALTPLGRQLVGNPIHPTYGA